MIGVAGPGIYSSMSDDKYTDLFLNAADDVNPTLLQDSATLYDNMAFYNEPKTNALGFASKNPVFMVDVKKMTAHNEGVYLQAPINPPKARQTHIINQNGATSGFKMCFAIGSQHLCCRESQPKHVANPA